MHVARVRRGNKGKEFVSVLLRQSYRDGGKVKHRTLASLTGLPPAAIEALERTLRGETLVPLEAAVRIVRSLPHGHVAAVLLMLRGLGLERLLDRHPSRRRDLATALIVARILAPASKLATARGLGATTLAAELGSEGATEAELSDALAWLLSRPRATERALVRRAPEPGSPARLVRATDLFVDRLGAAEADVSFNAKRDDDAVTRWIPRMTRLALIGRPVGHDAASTPGAESESPSEDETP